jgi:transcriptional regulator with XRE-family HTH domain
MRTVKALLDEALAACGGSQSELARRIHMHRQDVHQLVNGDRSISPVTVGYLCDLLEIEGDEARRLLALAVVESAKDPERAGVLRRAFFVLLLLGALFGLAPANDVQAMTAATSAGNRSASTATQGRRATERLGSLYIVARSAARRALARLRRALRTVAGTPVPVRAF